MESKGNVAGRGALALAGSLSACDFASKQLLATDSQPDGYPTVEALKFFAADLEKRSEGRIKTTVYPSEQLGSQNDTMELAQFGGVDFIRLNIAPLNVLVPETVVPALPFLFRSIPHMRSAMDGAPREVILAAIKDYDLIGLCFYDSGARSFYSTKRLIRETADLKGLKIRVQTSDLFVSMVEALGGDATPMAYGEVYQGLVQGVIDGAENNFPSFDSSRHFEVAKYYSLTRHVMAPEVLAISKHSWDKLNSTDQENVHLAAKASVPHMRGLWDAQVKSSWEKLQAANVEIADDIDLEPFAKKVELVWKQYLTSPSMQKLVDDILAIGGTDD